MKDRYKEHFGVERPSVLYENSERIEWIVSEADAERINTRHGKDTVQVGEKGTQLPPPETNEKAWERLVRLNAQQIFESLQIRWMEGTAPKALKAIQDRLKVINSFIEEAESLSLLDATEKPKFDCPKQEYLRIKYDYYNKNFCGSKDGWTIPGRTPNSGLTASIYAEYYLFKNWLERLLNEQSTNAAQINTTSSRFDLVGFLIACKNWTESSSEVRKYNERGLPTHFSKAKRYLSSFATNLEGKDLGFQIYLLEELVIEYLSFSENHPLAERIKKEIEATITALQQLKKDNEPTQSPATPKNTELEASTPKDSNPTKFSFVNKFDNVSCDKVYQHFENGLVKSNWFTDNELKKFLKAAFEDKKPPKDLFNLKNTPSKDKVMRVFYEYYKNVAVKPHGKQKEYAGLLGNYFQGFKTNTVSSNFSKSVY
ncbi:hypothetical protein [Nafulsella turpanensis]|uniref:hypothetical protein n=1 Tax=Nafulsella turpanensis TaxID=1265690 RepID=UPI000349AC6A|nr:hypothetical protein [Nafulsella turpanensis]